MDSIEQARRQAFREALQQAVQELDTKMAASSKQEPVIADRKSPGDLCYGCRSYGPWHGFRCL